MSNETPNQGSHYSEKVARNNFTLKIMKFRYFYQRIRKLMTTILLIYDSLCKLRSDFVIIVLRHSRTKKSIFVSKFRKFSFWRKAICFEISRMSVNLKKFEISLSVFYFTKIAKFQNGQCCRI